MLSFLSPLFLAGAAAAAIPIVLHLLKREPEPRVKFAAVRLLKRAPVEHAEKRHLRELLLLALRVVVLVLLALAFARPFLASGVAAGRSGFTVVALDTSYSLGAPGRFERARQLAKDAIARAPSGDYVGVVTFADTAETAARPSTDRRLASAAVDQAAQSYGATRYRAALTTAGQLVAGRRGTIVVITDLQENGWEAGDRVSIPEGATIDVVDVGAPPPNLAVVAIKPLADRLVATVRNTGPRPREVRAHLSIDGRPAGDATVPVAADRAADVTFAGAPRGGVAAVSVEDGDGIQADNVRYAVLGGTAQPAVLIVTGSGDSGREAFFVQHAIGAGTAEDGAYRTENVAAAQLSSWTDSQMSAHVAVVLLSTRGLERRGRDVLAAYIKHGGGLFIAAGPDVDGDVVADALGAGSTLRVVTVDGTRPTPRTLAPADARHPVFRPFSGSAATLGLVTFHNAARIGGAGCQTLARFTTGENAVLECPVGEGRAIVLASDLDNRWNDFPLHAAFVPFLHEVVRYLASAGAHPSDYLIGDAPAGVRQAPGIVTVSDPGQSAPRRIAINVDPREGEPGRLTLEDFQSAVTRLKDSGRAEAVGEARQQEDEQHLWQYALALMTVLLVVEGIVASRTA